ncbi:hypothetical protein C496_23431 [Natronorubrum tibetense GA33]|uniref:Uncharacterized protein n=2 Tax=Natronorubrum tibetense TaxID=63128 RepID=L9VEU2_9EURY|nr:hypothetical protein C496_23431 [Natronorubrum tibetense GA33]
MPDVRVFRNDGDEMFADDPGELDYIDPGVVLLYADTRANVVCSYFEGRLGYPVQATVECTFADGIDLGAVRPAVEEGSESEFSVAEAPPDNATSSRWALDGLSADPLPVAEPECDAIRRLVDGGREESWDGWLSDLTSGIGLECSRGGIVGRDRSVLSDDDLEAAPNRDADSSAPPKRTGDHATDGGGSTESVTDVTASSMDGAGLDFTVQSTYDAARFFAFLVSALADSAVTIAVSKAGRVDTVEDTDIVIHPNGDLPSDSRVKPLPETQDRIDDELDHVKRERVRGRLVDAVDDLNVAYRETVNDPTIDVETSKSVLRELLAERLAESSNLTVVDSSRARYRQAGIAVLAAFIGLVVGVVGGVAGADVIRRTALHGRAAVRDLIAAHPAPLGRYLVDAVSGVGGLTQGLMVAVSAFVLIVTVAIRHWRGDHRQRDLRPATARSDAVRVVLRLATLSSLIALFISIVLLWTAR